MSGVRMTHLAPRPASPRRNACVPVAVWKVWWRQRVQLVGDDEWAKLGIVDRLRRAELRGEFLCFKDQDNKVAPFGDPFSLNGFGLSFPYPLMVQRCGDVPSTISAQHPPRRPRPAPVLPPRWRSLCRRCTEPLEGGKGMGARPTPLMAAPSAHPQAADGCFRAATSLSRG